MGRKNQHFSTIIVTGKGHSQTKSFTIKTRYITYWKSCLFGGIILIGVLLVGVVALFSYTRAQNEKASNLQMQVAQLKQGMSSKKSPVVSPSPLAPVSKDTATRTQTYINQIQAKLKRVNEYLHKRGVQGFSTTSIGGNNRRSHFTSTETLELYNEYLLRVLSGLKATPLGYPHYGNITSGFGYRSDPFEAGSGELHAGMDFHGTLGEKVRSTANGKVIWASWFQGYGNCVRIAHGNGYQTLYGHLSAVHVKNGQLVQAGDVIGSIGSTGHSTGPHLHYEVRLNNKPINPNKFLSL